MDPLPINHITDEDGVTHLTDEDGASFITDGEPEFAAPPEYGPAPSRGSSRLVAMGVLG